MSHPHHHQHKRKRKNKEHTRLDRLVIALGIFNIFATLPQVYIIWVNKTAEGVSFHTWAYYTFFSAVLLYYGFVHKEKPIIVNYLGATFLYLLIAIGAVVYN